MLGGTAWLGHTVAEEALRRGHDVTCLARGTADPPPGATFVVADRDLDDGLSAVADEPWDAVVDVTRHPGHARRAVRDLAHRPPGAGVDRQRLRARSTRSSRGRTRRCVARSTAT